MLRLVLTAPPTLDFSSYAGLEESADEYWTGFQDRLPDYIFPENVEESAVQAEFNEIGGIKSCPSYSLLLEHLEGSEPGTVLVQKLGELKELSEERGRAVSMCLWKLEQAGERLRSELGEVDGEANFNLILRLLDPRSRPARYKLIESIPDANERERASSLFRELYDSVEYRPTISVQPAFIVDHLDGLLRPDARITRMMMEGNCSLCAGSLLRFRSTEAVLA